MAQGDPERKNPLGVASGELDPIELFRIGNRSKETLAHNARFLSYFLNDPKLRALALRSKSGKRRQEQLRRIEPFLDMTLEQFVAKGKPDQTWAEAVIAKYFVTIHAKWEQKEITADSAHNYRDPIKVACDMNNMKGINWDYLDKLLPKREHKPFKGPSPEKEVLRELCSYDDRRVKPIVLTLTSSGMRVSSLWRINIQDLIPYEKDGKIFCGIIRNAIGKGGIVYDAWISLEAYTAWQVYLDARKYAGEDITKPETPLVRDLWKGADRNKQGKGDIHEPRRFRGSKGLLEDAWREKKLRVKIGKNFNYKASHFGRKYFEKRCLTTPKGAEHPLLEDWQIKIFRGDVLPVSIGYAHGTFSDDDKAAWYLEAVNELSIFAETPTVEISKNDDKIKALERENKRLSSELEATQRDIRQTVSDEIQRLFAAQGYDVKSMLEFGEKERQRNRERSARLARETQSREGSPSA